MAGTTVEQKYTPIDGIELADLRAFLRHVSRDRPRLVLANAIAKRTRRMGGYDDEPVESMELDLVRRAMIRTEPERAGRSSGTLQDAALIAETQLGAEVEDILLHAGRAANSRIDSGLRAGEAEIADSLRALAARLRAEFAASGILVSFRLSITEPVLSTAEAPAG